jgi:hypothetical protein
MLVAGFERRFSTLSGHSFGPMGPALLADCPLFQGARWRVGMESSVVIVVSDADPFRLRSGVNGCLPNGPDSPITDFPGSLRMRQFGRDVKS